MIRDSGRIFAGTVIKIERLEPSPGSAIATPAIAAPTLIGRSQLDCARYRVFLGAVPNTWSQNGALTPKPRSWFWK